MVRTYEAIINEDGTIRLLQPVDLQNGHRAFVIVIDDAAPAEEGALLSEAALAEDWNRPEEDRAWAHLQPDKSS